MTQNVGICLEALSNIDLQTLYAEKSVLESYMDYVDKTETIIVMESSGNVKKKNPYEKNTLTRFMLFIKNAIRKMIDMFSDALVKMKTSKADFIEIPYEYTMILDDLKLMNEVTNEMGNLLKDVEEYDKNTVNKLQDIAKKAVFNVNNIKNTNRRYQLSRDKWLKLRDVIRDELNTLKTNEKRFSYSDEKVKDKFDDQATAMRILYTTFGKMATAAAKIMTSFTYSGLKTSPITNEDVEKRGNLVKMSKQELQNM